MWKHHLFVVLAIAWATQSMAAKRNFDFVLYNNTCTKYDDVFKRFDCAHKMVSKGRYLFDCFFMFERPLHKEAILQMILHYTPLKGIKPVKFLDVKINVCDILGQSGSNVPLMKALFKEFRKNSDLPYACPVRGLAKRNFDVEIYNVTCTKFDKVLKRFDCISTMITKGRYLADVVLVLARTLDKEAEFQFLVHFRPVKGEKSVKFLDVKLNVCDVLSKTSSVPLLKTLMDEVRRKGNLPYDCPMKGNYLYSLVNYSLDASLLPAYAPILAFNFTWTVFEYQKKIGCLGISGATVPRN